MAAASAVLRRAPGGRAEAERRHVPGGLFSLTGATGKVTTQTITYGKHGYWPDGSQPETCKTAPPCDDYNGIDDYTEFWWD